MGFRGLGSRILGFKGLRFRVWRGLAEAVFGLEPHMKIIPRGSEAVFQVKVLFSVPEETVSTE